MVTARLKCFNYLHIDAENKVAIRVKFEREFWLFLQLVNSISMHNKVGRPININVRTYSQSRVIWTLFFYMVCM